MDPQITHKQHHVPRVYLKGFSEDYNRVFFYNKTKREYSKLAVPVADLCYEKDLYEFVDTEGNLLNPNFIEKTFMRMESRFGKERNRLINASLIHSNFQRNDFFSNKSRAFWMAYCLLQVLRSPKVIAEEQKLYEMMVEPNPIEAKNASLYLTLPFWGEITEDSKNAFCALLKPMITMDIAVGVVDSTEELFTSDNPVYFYTKNYPCEEYGKIIFPITSKICLFFWGKDVNHERISNRMFKMSKELIEEIKWSVAYSAYDFIYSEHQLNRSDIALIRDAHKLSAIDRKDKGEFTLEKGE